MTTKLRLPKVSATLDPSVEVRPVYVEEAVESFAYANPLVLLEQTVQAVHQLNFQPLKPSRRITLLDLYLKPYAYGLDVRRSQKPTQMGASLKRQRAISRRLRLCAIELALGYKQALSEIAASRKRFTSNKAYRIGLQRSLLCASQAVLHCYDEYRPTEPRLWQEIIALFNAAEHEGLSQQPVAAAVDDPVFSQSIADCFKRFCLTSLVDPYHLAYGELWSVHNAFGEYASVAQIGEIVETKHPGGLFVIDPALDAKPIALAQYKNVPEPHCRLLDTNPVIAPLNKRHQRSGRGDALASHVLAAMIRELGLPPQRYTPREQGEGMVNIAVGVSTVHYFLDGTSVDVPPRGDDGEDIEIRDVPGQPAPRAVSYTFEQWRVMNEDHRGVAIACDTWPQKPLGVGELVGLQFPLRGDGEHDWAVGVVRWLKINDEQDHQAGVQVLAALATPMTAVSENLEETRTRTPRPALALPTLDDTPGNTLITPRGLFARGEMLRMQTHERSWLIEALTLSESASTFDRFTYRIIEG